MLIAPPPRRWLGLTTILVLAAGAASSAQVAQQPPVFRAAAELVEVIVRVTDKQGRFVPGLTQADFELREEGRAQTIVAFNRVDLPRPPVRTAEAAQPALHAPVGSTVATNADAAESRAFVLLLDDMLTSPHSSRSARQAAREFVQRFVSPTDLVAAFSTGGRGVQTQEFTTDKTRVLATIDRFIGRRCRTQENPREDSPRANAFLQETNNEKIYDVRVVTDVIKALASHLSGIRGRRVSLVWISEGVDYNPSPVIKGTVELARGGEPDPAAVNHAMQEAIQALQRANVTLYAVDPRRLYSAEQLLPEDLPEGMQPEMTSNPLCRGANPQELTRSLDTLREFSQKTGGFAAVNTNDFATAFDRVLDESSQYYVLGYQPTALGRDGEFKRIEVRTRRSGLQVSARAGYVVSAPRTPTPGPPGVRPALASVLTSSLPTAGLPLRVQAIPRRGAEGRGLVYVVVEVSGKDLQFTDTNGRFTERVEFGLIAIDGLARQSNVQPVAMDLSLTAGQLPQVRATGIRWLTTVDLAPGRYSLRVAGQAVGTNRTGSIFLDVDVPAFDADALRVDGVALTSLPAALGITTGTSPVPLGLPGPPTTARTFVQGDVVTLSAELGTTPRVFTRGTIELTVKAQAADATVPPVLQRTIELPDRAAAEEPRVFAIDTARLDAGAYVLRLALRDIGGRSAETMVLLEVIERSTYLTHAGYVLTSSKNAFMSSKLFSQVVYIMPTTPGTPSLLRIQPRTFCFMSPS
jgi:VWFA-related protein